MPDPLFLYACRCVKGKQILMHRVIMKAPEGMVVDHIEIGQFDDPVDAARARDMVARELQGGHAWLNLPTETERRQATGKGAGPVAGG